MSRAAALAGLLLALALGACRSPPDDPIEAPGPQPGVDVERAWVQIVLDPAALTVSGRARLVVRHPRRLTALRLGLDGALRLRSVRVDGRPVAYEREGDALVVPLAGTARASAVSVSYSGQPSAGLYAAHAAGQRVVFTDGWPDRTAGWLPAVHHPSDPFALDLTLVVPAAFDAALSGETVLDTVVAGERTVRATLPVGAPAYTAAFAVGRYVTVEDTRGTVPVRHTLLAGDRSQARRLGRVSAALDTLAALLGPYPFATFATVEVPLVYAGMENAAAPFLQADLYRQTAEGRNPVEEVAVHELVHQWWGNRVAPADWRDLWLAEGPATYLTAETLGRLDGGDAGMRRLALLVRETTPDDARRRLVHDALARPEDALSPTVYSKGAAVLHVLRLTVGERAFWRALRDVQAGGPSGGRTVSTAGFQAAFERSSGRDLDALFAFWVSGTDLPRLDTRWDRRSQTLSWEVSGDGGTLRGLAVRLLVRQGGSERLVPLADGRVRMPGAARPDVWPVGVLFDVR